ncbi:MAG: sensor histidine kinase [Saprospiraceae bacterium]
MNTAHSYIAPIKINKMSMDLENRSDNSLFRWLSHLFYWILISYITAYYGSLFGGTISDNLTSILSMLPGQLLLAYTFVYYFLPNFLYKRNMVAFIGRSFFVGAIALILARVGVIYVAEHIIHGEVNSETLWQIISDPIYLIQVYLPGLIIPVTLFFLIKTTLERFRMKSRENKFIKDKKEAELNFLKAQMNPHLLFNTLNNIYSCALQKSEHTAELILKLSEILDYTLYECRADKVNVTQEWKLIENYIDLEAMRFSEPIELILNQNITHHDAQVAPLILIALVENAFKHGLKKGHSTFIHIDLEVENNILDFHMKNSKYQSKNRTKVKGIGIKNIEKQLHLLYPKRHSLVVIETDIYYDVKLTIKL